MLQFSFNYIKSVVNFNKSLYSYGKEAMQKTNTNIKIMMLFTANQNIVKERVAVFYHQ